MMRENLGGKLDFHFSPQWDWVWVGRFVCIDRRKAFVRDDKQDSFVRSNCLLPICLENLDLEPELFKLLLAVMP